MRRRTAAACAIVAVVTAMSPAASYAAGRYSSCDGGATVEYMGRTHPEGTRIDSCAGISMLALPFAVLLAAADVSDPAILGKWLTESGHGVIEIVRCENAVCGSIVGIDRTPSEPMPTDVTGRSQCGLTIISEVTQAEDNAWYGKIVDPRDGATYRAKLWIDSGGRLNLRGYVGIPLLGSTQVWSRFTGRLAEDCRFG
jgi:uncharacterized protein (DUF2147 family)